MKCTIHNMMSPEEMSKVHETSLSILEETGMQIDHDQARSLLHDAGAITDKDNPVVKFPAALVEACLKRIPKSICLAGRDLGYDLTLSPGKPFVTRCSTGLTSVVDYRNGVYRDALLQDQKELAMLADALEHVNLAGSLTVHDAPDKTADLHAVKTLLENQRKHFMSLTMGPKSMRYQIEMQLAVRGSREAIQARPLFHPIACLISPLYIPENDVEIMMIAGEYGLPIKLPVLPMLGASAPVSLAGTLALGNAEVLGAFTVLQTLCPGNPTLYYVAPSLMNMRTGEGITAAPENSLLYAAFIQMARAFYQVPCDMAPLMSDGILPEQAAYQKGTNLLMAGLAGANIVAGIGCLDGGMAISLQQMVIDNEITAMTRQLLAGFEISEETLALDSIGRVGPRGNFLTDVYTLENCRKQSLYLPALFSYHNYASWQDESKYLPQKAAETVDSILATHEVPPLEVQVVRELERIVQAADEDIV